MNCLLIRADGDVRIGAGHVMRCLALAQEWQGAGGRVQFVMATSTPALEERLTAEGIGISHLAVQPGGAEDALRTLSLAHRIGAGWIVTDGYHFGAEYQRALRASGRCLLFVDDYGHAGHYAANLVLNQNIYADEALYVNREPDTRLLLGTRYVLLRREFGEWRGWRRAIPPIAHKVLVTLGGADPDNVTLKVIQALQQAETDGLEAAVVVGGSNPHLETLQSAIQNPKSKIENRAVRLELNTTDMPALMAWADLAVSAGGSTCWELAFMGLPNLILVLAENQQPVAAGLDVAGVAVNLGHPPALMASEIAQAVVDLATAPERRAAMARRGQELVDGCGAARVVQQMQGCELTLRPVQADDCHFIWEWANDPATRAASFSPEPIPWERHMEWFTAKLADPNSLFYIALDDCVPIGQIQYQIEGPEAVVSVNLASDRRGQSYGSQIIRLTSRRIFESTAVNLIHAYVKPDNVTSRRAFTRAGFIDSGLTEVRGHLAHHFILRGSAQL